VLATACLLGSLQVFTEAGFSALRAKSIRLTAYLEYLAGQVLAPHSANYKIITPKNPLERGCQLSFTFEHGKMMDVFNGLQANGLICDERKPTCIRLAPTPLYNSFTDVYQAVHTLKKVMDDVYGQN
jgi:kynureninase